MALSDRAQGILQAIAFSMVPLSLYIASQQDSPRWLIAVFGGIAVIIGYVKEAMGAKNAAVAGSIAGGPV